MAGRVISYVGNLFFSPPGSSRIKRSPKPRRKQQVNGCPGDAEKDRLITTDSDGTYKRPPGVHNSAYIGCPVRNAAPSPWSRSGVALWEGRMLLCRALPGWVGGVWGMERGLKSYKLGGCWVSPWVTYLTFFLSVCEPSPPRV